MEEQQNDFVEENERQKSRSCKKRESTALQAVGEKLVSLGEGDLQRLKLPPDLLQALFNWKKFKGHEAKRRQMQFIGRLMRELDEPDILLEILESSQVGENENIELLHLAESLRDDLLNDDESKRSEAVTKILLQYEALEPVRLRHLVNACITSKAKTVKKRMTRELFRYLRDHIDS